MQKNSFIPLSFAQQRLWFLDQLETNSRVFNVGTVQRLKGKLDIDALEKCFIEIIRRHDVLRTVFPVESGLPQQLVKEQSGFKIKRIWLDKETKTLTDSDIEGLLQKEANYRFSLSDGPLLNVNLYRLGENDHLLQLVMHHLVIDHWSMRILFKELSILYGDISKGNTPTLPELSFQYTDFTFWQRSQSQNKLYATALNYWKIQLEGATPLRLLEDRKDHGMSDYSGSEEHLALSEELTLRLVKLSREQGVTLFMLLLAAFKALLSRRTLQKDITLGIPIVDRSRKEVEGLIGFFLNTLVLRSKLDHSVKFSDFLMQVKNTCIQAYAHQEIPFEKLVEELNPPRRPEGNPFFDVFFNFYQSSSGGNSELNLEKLECERYPLERQNSQFPLSLFVRKNSNGLLLRTVFRQDLFSHSWISCLLRQYQFLLEQIVDIPNRPITDYSLIEPASQK